MFRKEHKKEVLKLGWETYNYGTGIQQGWEMVQHWLKRLRNHQLCWKETNYICPKCGSEIQAACVPSPVFVLVFRCKQGHKFSFEFTD